MDRKNLAIIYLGGLLSLMFLGQLLSFNAFVDAVANYRVASGASATVLAVIIMLIELVAATGLLLRKRIAYRYQRIASIAGLAIASLWSLLGLQAFLRALTLNRCGCFGSFIPQPLRWWILLEDVLFVLLALAVYKIIAKHRKH